MATNQSTVDFIIDQIGMAGDVRARKMFGDYAVYCNEKVVGLICDDQLFVKPSAASNLFEEECQEAPPYSGAKNYWLVPEEKWEDREWLVNFIRETAEVLPLPKPKKKK